MAFITYLQRLTVLPLIIIIIIYNTRIHILVTHTYIYMYTRTYRHSKYLPILYTFMYYIL